MSNRNTTERTLLLTSLSITTTVPKLWILIGHDSAYRTETHNVWAHTHWTATPWYIFMFVFKHSYSNDDNIYTTLVSIALFLTMLSRTKYYFATKAHFLASLLYVFILGRSVAGFSRFMFTFDPLLQVWVAKASKLISGHKVKKQ